ncbi:DNA topoisomerase IB [Sphingomonas morindae]|uniref:DNA topoisomerase n=1 Tax=Sphingomonas morindae TaxID=1541170 RepID=A0ABY4X8Y6_9SPHN|nr:DNA topoisomerase IB [Sphingomonas morindae]USI73382.1 DNA topoisomerase IB [Sphingomonas morindae]
MAPPASLSSEDLAQTAAGRLCYIDDTSIGITRRKARHGWAYFDAEGQRITDRAEIDRLNAVGLPPAYERCWFCPDPSGHLQAIGYDAKGRKQYRYHPEFRAAQEAEKYEGCADFGRALPAIRKRVDADLDGRTPTKRTAVAAVVRLLDVGHVRVGNMAYARENKSFGATTLRDRHASFTGAKVTFRYRGKHGKPQHVEIADRRLARVTRQCQDLPGQHLFQYVDAEGARHPVTSSDVNAYLREATGAAFSAKNFRTFAASVIAYEAIVAAGPAGIKLKTMLAPVAAALGNTPAISRKSYVHPALIALARSGGLKGQAPVRLPRPTRWLSPAERGLIAFLDTLAGAAEDRQAA